MSMENFKCPICKNPMTLAKPLKLELKIVIDDGTTDKMHSSFMICKVCNNIQLFGDIYRTDSLPS